MLEFRLYLFVLLFERNKMGLSLRDFTNERCEFLDGLELLGRASN